MPSSTVIGWRSALRHVQPGPDHRLGRILSEYGAVQDIELPFLIEDHQFLGLPVGSFRVVGQFHVRAEQLGDALPETRRRPSLVLVDDLVWRDAGLPVYQPQQQFALADRKIPQRFFECLEQLFLEDVDIAVALAAPSLSFSSASRA